MPQLLPFNRRSTRHFSWPISSCDVKVTGCPGQNKIYKEINSALQFWKFANKIFFSHSEGNPYLFLLFYKFLRNIIKQYPHSGELILHVSPNPTAGKGYLMELGEGDFSRLLVAIPAPTPASTTQAREIEVLIFGPVWRLVVWPELTSSLIWIVQG